MLHQKETDRIRAYPTHQAVQTTGSTAQHRPFYGRLDLKIFCLISRNSLLSSFIHRKTKRFFIFIVNFSPKTVNHRFITYSDSEAAPIIFSEP